MHNGNIRVSWFVDELEEFLGHSIKWEYFSDRRNWSVRSCVRACVRAS